eukprot:50156-Prorocentrum_minimum.AAC.1
MWHLAKHGGGAGQVRRARLRQLGDGPYEALPGQSRRLARRRLPRRARRLRRLARRGTPTSDGRRGTPPSDGRRGTPPEGGRFLHPEIGSRSLRVGSLPPPWVGRESNTRARNFNGCLTSTPARLTSTPTRLTSTPARLTSPSARLTPPTSRFPKN